MDNPDTEPEKETNYELVTRLMNFSRNGALMQPFILTAIEKYSEQCIAAGPEKFDSPILNGRGWIRCAEEALKALEEHFK
jgi:hypothetical protein